MMKNSFLLLVASMAAVLAAQMMVQAEETEEVELEVRGMT